MTTNQFEKQNSWRDSIALKLLIVTVLSFILLIPSAFVRSLIDERESRKNETKMEITSKWGNEQTICGPVLVVPYSIITSYSNGQSSTETKYFQVLPTTLKANGTIDTDLRHRGIYDVLVYTGDFNLKGTYDLSELKEWPDKYNIIHWDKAKLVVGITDLKGITKSTNLKWNEENKKFAPGVSECLFVMNGINSPVTINNTGKYGFEITFCLNGSDALFIVPVANETEVNMTSDWDNPSFDGSFITTRSSVNQKGFEAYWTINELNRPYPQIMTNTRYSELEGYQTVGVKLILPVDTYQKSTRSVKYALLFIALTFLIMFFSEVISKGKIHPVQYLLVGIALVIFYSLLIALAEYLSFSLSYLIASVVIVSMITAYIHSIFNKWKNTAIIAGSLVLLYVYLFTVTQIADYALLIGNIGLVIILGLVMLFSKKINWYGKQQDEPITTTINSDKIDTANQ